MTARRSALVSGFTLIEVIVGLVLATLLITAVHGLTRQIGASAREANRVQESLDRTSNARRWLKAAFMSSETTPETGIFEGEPDRLSFETWLQQPGGWFGRRSVLLALNGSQFVATVDHGTNLLLADSIIALRFDYLLDQGGDARWVGRWRSQIRTPVAVRIRVERDAATAVTDTMLFLLKERG